MPSTRRLIFDAVVADSHHVSAIHTQLTDALEGVTTELSTSPTMTGRFLMLRSTENTSVLLRTSPEARHAGGGVDQLNHPDS